MKLAIEQVIYLDLPHRNYCVRNDFSVIVYIIELFHL